MNIGEIKSAIAAGKFDESFKLLYGDTEAAAKRYSRACDSFKDIYPSSGDIRLFSAPGRTEVGGNHTDHQHGSVLAGSVNLDVIAVVSANNDGKIRIKSEGYDMDVIDINDLDKKPEEIGRAAALIRGVCQRFADMGCTLGGFDAYTTSNVLKGSGLSSSAAFEVLVGNILNGLFYDKKADAITIAKIGQYAEREYFGKPCGLLDQMASSLGGFTYADFSDPANPITESIDLDILSYGYTLCVVDTGGNHADLTDDYAGITVECREISNALDVDFLRDADVTRFYNSLGTLRRDCGDRAVLRAVHFYAENKRVPLQVRALEEGDFDAFLELVKESGRSSWVYLQNVTPAGYKEHQDMALALALCERYLKGRGASRVHGGGFAGTVQAFVPFDILEEFRVGIDAVLGEGACHVLSIRPQGGVEACGE